MPGRWWPCSTLGDRASADATGVFLYARDRDNLFADSVTGIESAGLSIVAAHVATGASGTCFNSYVVLGRGGTSLIANDTLHKRLVKRLTGAVAAGAVADAPARRVSRQLKQFVMPTEVSLETRPGAATSILRIVASDRPGLLAALGGLFAELGISVTRARITTPGGTRGGRLRSHQSSETRDHAFRPGRHHHRDDPAQTGRGSRGDLKRESAPGRASAVPVRAP